MLKIDFEFYKGILTKQNIEKHKLEDIINMIEFKYIVFNIDNIRQIDGYGIKCLINYSDMLMNRDGKAIICQSNTLFLDKFEKRINYVVREMDVFNMI